MNIGIDVERVKPIPEMRGVARKVMTDTEFTQFQRLPEKNQANSFFQLWTRKESVLKLLKTGFAMPPDRVETGLAAARRIQLELDGQRIYVQSFQHNIAGQPYQVALANSAKQGTAKIQQVAVKPD